MYAWSYGSHTSHTDMRVEVHFAYIRRWASFDGFNGRKTKLNKKASSKDKEKRKHFFLKNQILPNSHQRNKRTNFRPPKPKPDVTQFYTAGTLCTEIEKQKTKGRERQKTFPRRRMFSALSLRIGKAIRSTFTRSLLWAKRKDLIMLLFVCDCCLVTGDSCASQLSS